MRVITDIFRICHNEIKTIMHDAGILTFIVIVPILYPLMYAYVYTNEAVRNVPAAIVDECDSRLSREFVRNMDASAEVEIAARCNSMSEAQELMRRGKVYGIINIPSSFGTDIEHGGQTTIGLYCDMSSMLYYKALLITATNVSLEMNNDIKVERHITGTTDAQDRISKTPIEYDYIPLYNPQSGFAAFLIPPVLMLIIQQTLLLGIGMSMGDTREKYAGRVIPSDSCYNSPISIVAGKMLPFLLLYLLIAVYMFIVVTDIFSLPKLGDYATYMTFAAVYIISCIFFGMTLSFFVYRREDCIFLFVFMSVPLLFLSGISWPGASVPPFWKYVSYLFPSTFGTNGYVRINSMGASLSDVAFELKGLMIQSIVYFTTACLLYRRQIVCRLPQKRTDNKWTTNTNFTVR